MNNLLFYYFQLIKRLHTSNDVHHTFFGKRVYDIEQSSSIIRRMILDGRPCMVARIGATEIAAINALLNYKTGLKDCVDQSVLDTLCTLSGVFPSNLSTLIELYHLYEESCKSLDVAALLMNRREDFFFNQHCNHSVKYIVLRGLEPYYSKEPWSSALKDKRVLVISPFSKSIQKQYAVNRSKIWSSPDLLPEFELTTFTAVNSLANNTHGFDSWFDALSYMKDGISELDFDIAILGCGAYGFPLAAFIKQKGKQAIVLGGATQILFGIKGKRWDSHSIISHFYNGSWVRPMEEERIPGGFKVEGGCYW